MKIQGVGALQKKLGKIPQNIELAIDDGMRRTVAYGVRKAKSVVPVDEGKLRDGINGHFVNSKNGSIGFINFHGGTQVDALRVGAINYGRQSSRTGVTNGHNFIGYLKRLISSRHQRLIKRNIKKAISDS